MYPSWISRSLCSAGIVRCVKPLAQSRNETNSSWVNGADKSGFIFQICASGAAVQASHPATIKLTHYQTFRLDVRPVRMWPRGCFPTKTLAWPRRLYRMRDRCAVLRTLLQCVCTQRRNCIGQLSPFSEYAPAALRNKWPPPQSNRSAKPHESSASGGYLGIQCLQRLPRCDAQLGLQIPGAANRPPGVSRRASPCPSKVTRSSNSPPKSSPCWALPHSSPLHPHSVC
jgi:hypothetical protein